MNSVLFCIKTIPFSKYEDGVEGTDYKTSYTLNKLEFPFYSLQVSSLYICKRYILGMEGRRTKAVWKGEVQKINFGGASIRKKVTTD